MLYGHVILAMEILLNRQLDLKLDLLIVLLKK